MTMTLKEYKIFLLNHSVIKNMDTCDFALFCEKIYNNKPFNNMSYYIQKYNLNYNQINLIDKYIIAVNNYRSENQTV